MNPRRLFIAAVAVIAIATGTWLSFNVASPPPPPPQPVVATLLPAGNELPAFSLLDHNGSAIDQGAFVGNWDLVFFGFTHCPDICPMTLQVLAEARGQLAADGFDPLPRIVLVSVDPERDTPEQLGSYIGYFGDGNLGITGDLEEIRKLTGGLGIWFEKSGTGDDYSVDHSAAVLVIDPAGQLRALFSAPHKAENYVHDLPIVMSAK
jgi:protein SCO1/2